MVDWGNLRDNLRMKLLVRRWKREFSSQTEKSFEEFFSEKYHNFLDKTYKESVEDLQEIAKNNAIAYREGKQEVDKTFGQAED